MSQNLQEINEELNSILSDIGQVDMDALGHYELCQLLFGNLANVSEESAAQEETAAVQGQLTSNEVAVPLPEEEPASLDFLLEGLPDLPQWMPEPQAPEGF